MRKSAIALGLAGALGLLSAGSAEAQFWNQRPKYQAPPKNSVKNVLPAKKATTTPAKTNTSGLVNPNANANAGNLNLNRGGLLANDGGGLISPGARNGAGLISPGARNGSGLISPGARNGAGILSDQGGLMRR